MSADVVVLGAGIIGAAVARELALAGLDVVLVDAGEPGTGASGRCDGNVLVQTKHDALGIEMTQYGVRGYERWAAELDVDIHLHRKGSLVFFSDEAGMAAARRRVDWLAAAGVSAALVGYEEIHELEPSLGERVLGGIDCADDSTVYPPSVVAGLVRDAVRSGCRLMTHTRALRLTTSAGGRVSGVETDRGVLRAARVVNALGSWSPGLAGAGEPRLPVVPRQGVLAVTDCAPGLVNRPVTEGHYMTTRASAGDGDRPGFALVAEPTFRGNVLIGSMRRFCGYDHDVDHRLLATMLAHAIDLLPALAAVPVLRTFAGLRPWTPDNRPVIGASRTTPGYFLATGHEGEGIGLAPVTADVVAALVTGTAPAGLLERVVAACDPHRFDGEGPS